ncbi:MAG: GFA family protein [Alphaproteobacteria bacterium]|nr:MAG: GFA family protein [Alphaproteobacteria bacterium]
MITGSCHCGAVRFEVSRPDFAVSCNCSICRRLAALWVYAPPLEIRLFAPEGTTRAYSWGVGEIAFHSCSTCGVCTHYIGLAGDRVAVNLRLADRPEVVEQLRVRHFDGANSWAFLD